MITFYKVGTYSEFIFFQIFPNKSFYSARILFKLHTKLESTSNSANFIFFKIISNSTGGFTNDGAEYQKTFFIPRYSTAHWAESKGICKSHGFELATFETLQEAQALLTMTENHSFVKPINGIWFWVNGITLLPKTATSWYWADTGNKISFPIPWISGQPSNTEQYCLGIGKPSLNVKFGFVNGFCSGHGFLYFVCQRTDLFVDNRSLG
jgi:hypothetical protein